MNEPFVISAGSVGAGEPQGCGDARSSDGLILRDLRISGGDFRLSGSFRQVSESSRQVSESSRQLSGSFRQLSGSFRQLSGSSRQVSGSFRQVSGSFRQVNGSFVGANGSSVQVNGSFVEADGSSVQVNGALVEADGSSGKTDGLINSNAGIVVRRLRRFAQIGRAAGAIALGSFFPVLERSSALHLRKSAQSADEKAAFGTNMPHDSLRRAA